MNDVKFEYAKDFQQNEAKWEERKEQINEALIYFSKNTILQLTAMDVMMSAYDFLSYIDKGGRCEFLAREIDVFLVSFNEIKERFEKSGVSDAMAKLATKITSKELGND